MATTLRRIEKEFILGAVRDDRARLLLLAGNGEWPVEIKRIESDHLVLGHSLPLRLLKRGIHYEFRFAYRDQAMAFRAKTLEIKEGSFTIEMPDKVYKNLGRRFSRRAPPPDLAISFSFKGERFELAFPVTGEYAAVTEPVFSKDFNPDDIRGLIRSFNSRTEDRVSDRAIVMFKERQPESIEERIVAKTGKILFLGTTAGGIPKIDPMPHPMLITRPMFADFFRDEGFRGEFVEDEVARFERNKRQSGILSELLIPILFQEYVIGCVSLQNRTPGREPFDLGMVETFQLFSQVLAWSLRINGYFRGAAKKDTGIKARVLDVSASGLLFVNEEKETASMILPDSRLDIHFSRGERRMKVSARVLRSYRDGNQSYYGLEYDEIQPEDFRFLFEVLYGRSFTDADGLSVEGLTVKKPLIDFGAKS